MKIVSNKDFGLKNKGGLELFFIGTGSAFAASLDQTNFLIIKGYDHVMVDFGMTAPKALLAKTNLKPTDIEVILPTHSHADHVGGIECLALMNRYVGRRFLNKSKIKMVVTEEYQRILWDYTLRGGLEYNEELAEAKRKLSFGDYFDIIRPRWKTFQPREIFEVDIGGIHLEIFRTKHVPEQAGSWEDSFISYGLFIDDRVLVSGDTRFDPQLIELYGSKAEVIFHDVQFFPEAVHASLEDLKSLPGEIKDKTYLFHYADNWLDQKIDDFAGWTEEGKRYIF